MMVSTTSMPVAILGLLLVVSAYAQRSLLAAAPTPAASDKAVRTFAVFGDWGRNGGAGSEALNGLSTYDPAVNGSCPESMSTPFYITIDGSDGVGSQPDSPCVRATCGHLTSDKLEDCVGSLQQLQAAYLLNQTCADRGCEFVLNTADNFYTFGCNKTNNVDSGPSCANRFSTSWANIYQTAAMSAINNLIWYSSLGNHDMFGGTEGIQSQIAYTQEDFRWYLPDRYYSTSIGTGPTAINLVVFNSDPFIDGYLDPTSDYSKIDEMESSSTEEERQKQLIFIEKALTEANEKPGWTLLMGHHPAFSGDESYFRVDETGVAESTAWAQLANLTKLYKPVAYLCGHDHVIDYSAPVDFSDTAFIVSGAGSFSEPNDGAWNKSSGSFKSAKPYFKYSNINMNNGQTFVGNVIVTVTATEFKAEFFSAETGVVPQYTVSCVKKKNFAGNTCTGTPGIRYGFSQHGSSSVVDGIPVASGSAPATLPQATG